MAKKTTSLNAIIAGVLERELPAFVAWDDARPKAHIADRGGLTRGGITARSWSDYKGWQRLATYDELNAISKDEAIEFYRARYLAPFELVREPLRTLLVDWSVTSHWDDPVAALQATLQRRGLYKGRIDGVMGPKTHAAILADDDLAQTCRDVACARVQFYVRLALSDKRVRAFRKEHPDTDLENLNGWVNRALAFL